jgi:hypothetical protein
LRPAAAGAAAGPGGLAGGFWKRDLLASQSQRVAALEVAGQADRATAVVAGSLLEWQFQAREVVARNDCDARGRGSGVSAAAAEQLHRFEAALAATVKASAVVSRAAAMEQQLQQRHPTGSAGSSSSGGQGPRVAPAAPASAAAAALDAEGALLADPRLLAQMAVPGVLLTHLPPTYLAAAAAALDAAPGVASPAHGGRSLASPVGSLLLASRGYGGSGMSTLLPVSAAEQKALGVTGLARPMAGGDGGLRPSAVPVPSGASNNDRSDHHSPPLHELLDLVAGTDGVGAFAQSRRLAEVSRARAEAEVSRAVGGWARRKEAVDRHVEAAIRERRDGAHNPTGTLLGSPIASAAEAALTLPQMRDPAAAALLERQTSSEARVAAATRKARGLLGGSGSAPSERPASAKDAGFGLSLPPSTDLLLPADAAPLPGSATGASASVGSGNNGSSGPSVLDTAGRSPLHTGPKHGIGAAIHGAEGGNDVPRPGSSGCDSDAEGVAFLGRSDGRAHLVIPSKRLPVPVAIPTATEGGAVGLGSVLSGGRPSTTGGPKGHVSLSQWWLSKEQGTQMVASQDYKEKEDADWGDDEDADSATARPATAYGLRIRQLPSERAGGACTLAGARVVGREKVTMSLRHPNSTHSADDRLLSPVDRWRESRPVTAPAQVLDHARDLQAFLATHGTQEISSIAMALSDPNMTTDDVARPQTSAATLSKRCFAKVIERPESATDLLQTVDASSIPRQPMLRARPAADGTKQDAKKNGNANGAAAKRGASAPGLRRVPGSNDERPWSAGGASSCCSMPSNPLLQQQRLMAIRDAVLKSAAKGKKKGGSAKPKGKSA